MLPLAEMERASVWGRQGLGLGLEETETLSRHLREHSGVGRSLKIPAGVALGGLGMRAMFRGGGLRGVTQRERAGGTERVRRARAPQTLPYRVSKCGSSS